MVTERWGVFLIRFILCLLRIMLPTEGPPRDTHGYCDLPPTLPYL